MTAVRVAFVIGHTDDRWIGGTNYIRNLIQAVLAAPDSGVQPVVLVPPGASPAFLNSLPGVEVIHTRLVSGHHLWRVLGKVTERLLGRNIAIEMLFRLRRIDVLSHATLAGPRSPLPTIVWIPDFQHRRLPDFFSVEEIARRDVDIRRAVRDATRVILSSHDAQRDLERFIPGSVAKSDVLHFVSGVGGEIQPTDLTALQTRYGFQGPYFHLPNQFWHHKNHGVVVSALAELKGMGKSVTVICTGSTEDYRHPEYFAEFIEQVSVADVGDSLKLLGVVPYEDMRGLMLNAVAVINPSFFEGWSTTVEEAKSLGKAIILSDIPVHCEQAPERGVMFDPNNASQLAVIMNSISTSHDPSADARYVMISKSNLAGRFIEFGKNYGKIVAKAFGERA